MEMLPLRKFDAVVLSIRTVDVSSLTAMSAIQSFPILYVRAYREAMSINAFSALSICCSSNALIQWMTICPTRIIL